MNNNPGGKGDAPRPKSVDEPTFQERWDAIDWSAHRDEQEQEDGR